MTQAMVGRQPIFDRSLNVYGYELLFRPEDLGSPSRVNGEAATSQVVANAFMEIGLDAIVGGHLAFINVTRDFLLEQGELPFPKEKVVLEVLESVRVDDDLVAAVAKLTEEGYVIALDDFEYHPRWDPLLERAKLVKLDVRALDYEAVKEHLRILGRFGVEVLAEKVETESEFERLRELGLDYFQGFFLSKPNIVHTKRLPSSQHATLELMARLQDPLVSIEEVEKLISQDVALSYKLLRYINSAFFSLPRKVESIHRAAVYLGLRALKQWATLLAMTGVNDKPVELMRVALTRGKMCELLCQAGGGEHPDSYFTVGLFSALGSLMDQPLGEVLVHLPLSDTLSKAILEREGDLGAALACTLAYEICDWSTVSYASLDEARIAEAYLQAVDWSFKLTPWLT